MASNIRNKKIAKIRIDKNNFDAPTINRALDNIIDNLNPFIEQTSKATNSRIDVITIEPSGTAAVVSDNFILSGSGGITFTSNPTLDTITIAQAPAPPTSIDINVSGASTLTGSVFNVSGSGIITLSTPDSGTLIIDAPATPILFPINTDSGSIANASGLNIFSGSCSIFTYTSGSNVYISSSAKPLTGSTNITVAPAPTQVVANPNTTFLWHADNGNLATASTNDGFAALCVGFEQVPLISENTTHAYLSTANSKFGASSLYLDGTLNLSPFVKFTATGTTSLSLGLAPNLVGFRNNSGDFTIEMWVYPEMAADAIATVRSLFYVKNTNASSPGLQVGIVKHNVLNQLYLYCDNGQSSFGTTPVGSIADAAWSHVAVSREGSTIRVFINGTLYLTASSASPSLSLGIPNTVEIGNFSNQYTWKGYVDEIRISDLTCLYTASFTAPTAAFGNYFSSSNATCLDQVSLNNNISLTSITASGGFSGNLFGTASFATNALSSSFATTASFASNALSSSFATTASFASNALSSSFATNALTASYALNGAVGGDLSGSTANATVIRLQGRDVSAAAPLDGESLVWSSLNNFWQPQIVSGSGGGLVNLPTYHETGSLASGSVQIQLPNGPTEFPVADLDYVIYNASFRETSGSDWKNDIGSIALFVSSSSIYAQIDAPAAPYAYNFNATNTNISSSAQFSPPRYFGSFSDTTTQTASLTTDAYTMYFNTDEGSSGFNIVSGSRITAQYAGTYNLQFSAQVNKGTGGPADVKIWLRKNGTNVPRTATKLHIQGNNAAAVAAWNFVQPLTASEYLELMWQTSDTAVNLLFENSSSSPDIPQIPSIIATIQGV